MEWCSSSHTPCFLPATAEDSQPCTGTVAFSWDLLKAPVSGFGNITITA